MPFQGVLSKPKVFAFPITCDLGDSGDSGDVAAFAATYPVFLHVLLQTKEFAKSALGRPLHRPWTELGRPKHGAWTAQAQAPG